jgi:hypothetical protein
VIEQLTSIFVIGGKDEVHVLHAVVSGLELLEPLRGLSAHLVVCLRVLHTLDVLDQSMKELLVHVDTAKRSVSYATTQTTRIDMMLAESLLKTD